MSCTQYYAYYYYYYYYYYYFVNCTDNCTNC